MLQIAKETVRIKKKTQKIKADFASKAKKRIIKCKTDVSSTLRESSGWLRNGKNFKRRRYETLRNCEFFIKRKDRRKVLDTNEKVLMR